MPLPSFPRLRSFLSPIPGSFAFALFALGALALGLRALGNPVLIAIESGWDIGRLPEAAIGAHQEMLHFTLFLLISSCLVRRPSVGIGFLCALGAWGATSWGLIDLHLHTLASSFNLYPASWAHQGFVNPQWAKISLFLIAFPLSLFLFFLPSWRGIERFFICAGATACLGATLFFHWVIPQGALFWDRQISSSITRGGLEATEADSFSSFCAHMGMDCFRGSREEALAFIRTQSQTPQGLERAMAGMPRPSRDAFVHEESGMLGFRFSRLVSGARHEAPDVWRVALERSFIGVSQARAEAEMSMLGAVACFVWSHGLWLLLSIHRWMFHRRQKRSSERVNENNGKTDEPVSR